MKDLQEPTYSSQAANNPIQERDYSVRFSETETSKSTQKQGNDLKSDAARTKLRSELQEWMKMTTELLTKFINMLQEYDRELNLFFSKGVYYFCGPVHNLNVSDEAVASLTSINMARDELGRFLVELQNIKDCLCKDISRDVRQTLKTRNAEVMC